MVDPDRVRIWVARFAAPVAFFFAATVLVLLVQRALEKEDAVATSPTTVGTGVTDTTPATTTIATTPDGTTTQQLPRGCRRRNYVVKSGDTLQSIADKCETTVEELLLLNPDIDPLALNPGDRVRLRPPA